MMSNSQASSQHQPESRPDVNDPNTVDRLTRDAIRILTSRSQPNKRRRRRK